MRSATGGVLANSFTIAPLLDPMLQTIDITPTGSPDKNTLNALIYTRYLNELNHIKISR